MSKKKPEGKAGTHRGLRVEYLPEHPASAEVRSHSDLAAAMKPRRTEATFSLGRCEFLNKHSAVVAAATNLSLVQLQIYNYLLKQAQPLMTVRKEHELAVHVMAERLEWDLRNLDYYIEQFLSLSQQAIEYNIFGKSKGEEAERWEQIGREKHTVLPKTAYYRELGIICFTLPDGFGPLAARPYQYGRINLDVQRKFRSKYTSRLYEVYVDALGRDLPATRLRLPVERLYRLFDFDPRRAVFKRFNQNVLKVAHSEINSLPETLIFVEDVQQIRTRAGVTSVVISIKRLAPPKVVELPRESAPQSAAKLPAPVSRRREFEEINRRFNDHRMATARTMLHRLKAEAESEWARHHEEFLNSDDYHALALITAMRDPNSRMHQCAFAEFTLKHNLLDFDETCLSIFTFIDRSGLEVSELVRNELERVSAQGVLFKEA